MKSHARENHEGKEQLCLLPLFEDLKVEPVGTNRTRIHFFPNVQTEAHVTSLCGHERVMV